MSRSIIDGLKITPLRRISHDKGDIFHVLRNDQPDFFPIGEVYCSSVHKSVIKGWKKHHLHKVNLTVVCGSIHFFIIDDRNSAKPLYNSFIFDPLSNHARLTVPPGVWLAFKGLADVNIIINAMPDLHDPTEQTNIPLNSFSFDSFIDD